MVTDQKKCKNIGEMYMKLSIGIGPKQAAADAYVLCRGFETAIPMAKKLGYDGVELALMHKDDLRGVPLASLLSKYDLEVSCITSGQVFSGMHLYLTHPDIIIRQQAIDVLFGLMSVAKQYGAMLNIGRVRGIFSYGQTREQAEAMFVNSMSYLLDRAARDNVPMVIEPINRYEINFINSLADCVNALEWFSGYDIGLMPDLFHMNIEERSIGDTLASFGPLIKYVHLADSNRLSPGWGHINFEEVFAGLRTGGFDGWCCIEALPIPTEYEAAKQAIEYIRPFLHRVEDQQALIEELPNQGVV